MWTEGVVREYGSVMRFVLGERLGWGEGEVGMAEGGFGNEGAYPCYLLGLVDFTERKKNYLHFWSRVASFLASSFCFSTCRLYFHHKEESPYSRFFLFHLENYKILPNDWPYGIDPLITHLVVWTKFSLPSDPLTDDLLPSSRAEIDAFVRRKFVEPCGEENVIWFRNWGALKSVHAVEHFHVLVFDPPRGFVEGVTGGDGELGGREVV